jgi:hypothetical protein
MYSALTAPFTGHGATVRAWGLFSNHASTDNTQNAFDSVNFIDGYNLYLKRRAGTSAQYYDALEIAFVTPMPNTKYKVFLNGYSDELNPPSLLHVVSSSVYPKTTNSFFVRLTYPKTSSIGVAAAGRDNNQFITATLWSNFPSFSFGLVVFA